VRNIPFPEFVARPTVFAFDKQRKYPRIHSEAVFARLDLYSYLLTCGSCGLYVRVYRPLNPDIARFGVMKELFAEEEEEY